MKVLLADGQAKERALLRWLLAQDSEIYLVGEATEAQDVLAHVQAEHPDLLLLDWELPGLQDTDLLLTLRCLGCPLQVVAFGKGQEAGREAAAAGANAFVSKEEPVEQLLNTVRKVGRLSPCFV